MLDYSIGNIKFKCELKKKLNNNIEHNNEKLSCVHH